MKRYTCVLLLLISGCVTERALKTEIKDSDEIYKMFDKGKKLVMVTHPDCGFSKRAFEDFSPKIQNYLRSNGVVIAPVQPKYIEEQLASVVAWNSKSEFKHIPSVEDRIHEVELESTPQFYFFRDGTLIEKITGWPKDKSNLSKIEKAIDSL